MSLMYPFYLMAFLLMSFGMVNIFLVVRDDVYYKAIENYFFVALVIFLIFFAGSRGVGTGVDDLQYRWAFMDAANRSQLFTLGNIIGYFRYEPLTTLIMYLTSCVTRNPGVFLFIYASISIAINAITYKKSSPLIFVSLAVYACHLYINKDMNQIRFGLASALYVLSLLYQSERKYIQCGLLFILACLAHETAYAGIFFLVSQFYKGKYTPLIILSTSFILGLIGSKVVFGNYINDIPLGASKYDGSEFDTDIPVFSISNIKNLFFVFLYCKYLIEVNNLERKWDLKYMLVFCFSVGAGIRVFFSDFSIIGTRVGNLFIHLEPILFSMLLYRLRNDKLMALILFVSVCLFYIIYNTALNPQAIMGYKFNDIFGF